MPNILHRLTVDAPPERVRELTASQKGIENWWTGRPVTGDDGAGGQISVYFGDADSPAAVFEVVERIPARVVWRCVDGPGEWIDTRVTFVFKHRPDGGTTLVFSHEGWKHESEFMNGCSTNWASYLMSLKSGAEGQGFRPHPSGEISRWD